MRKSTKIWLIVASILTLSGALIFACAMATENWDFTKLSSVKYETNIYELSESFGHIQINTNTVNITILPTDEPVCKVECFEPIGANHTVEISENRLIIGENDTREWHEYISLDFNTAAITLYLPRRVYGHISIEATTADFTIRDIDLNVLTCTLTTGEITVKDLDCKMDVRLSVSTGSTTIENLKCDGFSSKGNTGDITLKSLISTSNFDVVRTTGDIYFSACDAAEISIETGTGDVAGTWLTPKIFLTETDTGKVNVPASTTGGKCTVKTTTGDVNISIK